MAVNTKQFLGATLSGCALTGILVGTILLGGVAVAVPTGGVGGFTVLVDQLEGQDMELYPTMANTSSCSEYPSAVTTIESGTMQGLTLYKDVQLPNDEEMRLRIQTDKEVRFTGLSQRFTYLKGDMTFENGQTITQDSSGAIEDRFTLGADTILIEDAKINSQGQFVRSIELEDAEITVEMNPENDVQLGGDVECAA